MKICIIAGMIDQKLQSKLSPLQHSDLVKQIYLIRRQNFQGKKIRCFALPAYLNKIKPLAEVIRFFIILWVALRHRPNCLIAFGTIPHGIYAWLIGKLFKIPVIQHVMGKNDLRLTYPNQSFRKLALTAVAAGEFIAVRGCAAQRYLLSQQVARHKIFVASNVHDFTQFKPMPAIKKQYDLIYVGLLANYKRLDILLDCIYALKKQQADIKLLLVGDGPLKNKLKQQCRQLNIENNVTFYGECEFNQLPYLYNQAKVFIMTSQGEGLPMAMIEALSCALPVIISNDADISDIAIDGINACVIKTTAGDYDSPLNQANISKQFARCCLKLLNDEGRYQQLVKGAQHIRAQKQNQYSLDAQAELWQHYLQQCLSLKT